MLHLITKQLKYIDTTENQVNKNTQSVEMNPEKANHTAASLSTTTPYTEEISGKSNL